MKAWLLKLPSSWLTELDHGQTTEQVSQVFLFATITYLFYIYLPVNVTRLFDLPKDGENMK